MTFTYKSIQDWTMDFYNQKGIGFVNKTAYPLLTTTTGALNRTYGPQLWTNLNLEANAFGCTPKEIYERSGFRAITARPSDSVTGGTAEDGSIPDPVKPTFAIQNITPKRVAHTSADSDIQEKLSKTLDDAIGMDGVRQFLASYHAENINKMLLTNVTTLASTNIESLDRICSSYAEVTNCGDVDANDADIYSVDRDGSAGWTDATVSHGSNTDRSLTDSIYNGLYYSVLKAGGNPTYWLTGHNTMNDWAQIEAGKHRLLTERWVKGSVNGVETLDGQGTGLNVSTHKGLPIILSKDVVEDGSERIYLLDTSQEEFGRPRLCMSMLEPTMYYEAGLKFGNPFVLNNFQNEIMFTTVGELLCRKFNAQGKIRDLS